MIEPTSQNGGVGVRRRLPMHPKEAAAAIHVQLLLLLLVGNARRIMAGGDDAAAVHGRVVGGVVHVCIEGDICHATTATTAAVTNDPVVVGVTPPVVGVTTAATTTATAGCVRLDCVTA